MRAFAFKDARLVSAHEIRSPIGTAWLERAFNVPAAGEVRRRLTKNMKRQILLIFMCVGVLSSTACRRRPPPDFPIPGVKAAEAPAASALPLTPAIEQAVRRKGETIAAQAFGVLSSRLGQAIADAGYTNAVEFCSVHGITFTKSIGVTNQVILRRVTHRPRNPQNRADTSELAVIRKFQTDLSSGVTPPAIVATNKSDYFTYYAPITLQLPLCLSCHGDPARDIHSDTLAQIKQSYPNDEATGFETGQLRGLWSIDFKRSDFGAAAANTKE